MTDLQGISNEAFTLTRERVNASVRQMDIVCRTINGQSRLVPVYSMGIADGARLGYIRTPRRVATVDGKEN